MKNRFYIAHTLVLLIFLVACKNAGKENGSNEVASPIAEEPYIQVSPQQFKNLGMKLGTIETQIFPEIVKANGFIDVPPENRAIVSAIMGGYITRTPLLIGDKVTKGQALVVLENQEFVALQQEYLEIKAELDYLKEAYERQKTLYDENISSEKGFLRTKSEYDMKMATLKGLGKQLSMINISPTSLTSDTIRTSVTLFAPITGSITNVHVSRGSYVLPNTPILEIVNGDHMHLELSIFERDIMKIRKGQKIEFMIPEASDYIYTAEVHLVGTSINTDKTIKVHGHIDDKDKNNFITGMYVSTNIITKEVEQPSLPSEAIVNIEDTSFVLQLMEENDKGYSFKIIQVAPANSNGDHTSLMNAHLFKEDATFLVKGAFNLIGE